MTSKKRILLLFVLLVLVFLIFLTLKGVSKMNEGDSAGNPRIKLATFAVCEQKDNQTHCSDQLFASCNGNLTEINETSFNCDGKTYDAENNSLGETSNPENWTDPRDQNLINAWATSD
jgi:hypothetical protein